MLLIRRGRGYKTFLYFVYCFRLHFQLLLIVWSESCFTHLCAITNTQTVVFNTFDLLYLFMSLMKSWEVALSVIKRSLIRFLWFACAVTTVNMWFIFPFLQFDKEKLHSRSTYLLFPSFSIASCGLCQWMEITLVITWLKYGTLALSYLHDN